MFRKLDGEDNLLERLGRDCYHKFFWKGDNPEKKCVGILTAQKWTSPVISVTRDHRRLLDMELTIGSVVVNITCAYAPQSGLVTMEKEAFYKSLLNCISSVD